MHSFGPVQYMLLRHVFYAAFIALKKVMAAVPEPLDPKKKLRVLQQILKQVPGLNRQVAPLTLTTPSTFPTL